MVASITDTVVMNDGRRIPRLGLGTWQSKDGDEVEQSVKWALQLGYRHIDTAAIYQNERGVGRAIRDSGVPRDEIFVTTKLWNTDQGYDSAFAALRESLERLGMDYVDLYLIHWPGPRSAETWRAMQKMRDDGLCRSIGVSNFLVPHLNDLLGSASVVPAVNQIEFHPYLQQPQTVSLCHERGIVVEAWSPLMKGRVGDIPEVAAIAQRHGRTAAQVTLRWQLQRGLVTIPKSIRQARLQENAAVFDFQLDDAELAALDALDRGDRTGPDPNTFGF